MKTLELFINNTEEQMEVCELARVPEALKGKADSCFRSAFFSEEGKANCFGPLTLVFSIRTARDLLLEGCEYQGLEIKLETAGKILPVLPAYSELQKLLNATDTFIYVNGQVYKPNTEVYGFQQVYDDSVKCIENLKKLGFTNESMAIYATPEDITVEVNGLALGLEGNNELSSRYYRLLCYLADIKEVGGKPQKTSVKTILFDPVLISGKVLLPGSIHPTMRRTKIGVGASHFAYGIAAFSDACGKKRTSEENIQESLNWLKFIEKEVAPVSGIRELLDTLPHIALPGKAGKVAAVSNSESSETVSTETVTTKNLSGVFQPLKEEIEAASADFKGIPAGITAFSSGLDKVLGRGWSYGGLHIVIGNRESGKAAMLLQQAILSENKLPVLCVSFDQNLKGFVTNAASLIGGINRTEMISGLVGANANQVKLALGAAIDKLHTKLSKNLFFSGVESGRVKFETDEIMQLANMLPDAPNRLVVIDSVSEEDLGDNPNIQLQKLKSAALANNLTVIMSIHVKTSVSAKPNVIDSSDFDYLAKYQRFSDTLLNVITEKTNLRKFVAMIKGQVDPNLVANLEQKSLQLSGGKKLKSDTYSLLRVIHNRSGRRDLMLFLYQPDMGRFYELASVGLTRL